MKQPFTIPQIDLHKERIEKRCICFKGRSCEPNVNIQDRINEASLQLKNIFQDIRKEEKYSLKRLY